MSARSGAAAMPEAITGSVRIAGCAGEDGVTDADDERAHAAVEAPAKAGPAPSIWHVKS
jgi:hypothetical protein